MVDKFNPYWFNWIYKRMMEWYNNFFPGLMCVGQKPHFFGYEHHINCCWFTSILWREHIFKRKEILAQMGPKLCPDIERTVRTMPQVWKRLFSMGKAFVMGSRFFVVYGIDALAVKEVYAGSLIKERWNWSISVPGDIIDQNFRTRRWGM